jgi:hypothetical protein
MTLRLVVRKFCYNKKQPSVGETLGAILFLSKGRGEPFERIKNNFTVKIY